MPAPSSAATFSRRIDRLTRVLVLLVLAAGVAGAILVAATGRPEPLPVAASALTPGTLQLPGESGRSSNDLVFRPLFWQERRPLEPPQQVATVDTLQPGQLEGVVLLGVYSSGTVSGAVLSVRGARQRLKLGERLEGWELVAVAEGEAQFAQAGDDGQPLRLVLERSTNE